MLLKKHCSNIIKKEIKIANLVNDIKSTYYMCSTIDCNIIFLYQRSHEVFYSEKFEIKFTSQTKLSNSNYVFLSVNILDNKAFKIQGIALIILLLLMPNPTNKKREISHAKIVSSFSRLFFQPKRITTSPLHMMAFNILEIPSISRNNV